MAGIEKVCELTGDYEGYLMYSQKHNSIQVLNKHKKHFRHANHELIIVPNSKILKHKQGNYSTYKSDNYLHDYYEFKDEQDYLDYKKENGYSLKTDYIYCLRVFEHKLQGEVGGLYYQYSHDLKTVKRKLKRMLRCRELNVTFIENPDILNFRSGYDIIKDYINNKTILLHDN